jgi:hypothetical protein
VKKQSPQASFSAKCFLQNIAAGAHASGRQKPQDRLELQLLWIRTPLFFEVARDFNVLAKLCEMKDEQISSQA